MSAQFLCTPRLELAVLSLPLVSFRHISATIQHPFDRIKSLSCLPHDVLAKVPPPVFFLDSTGPCYPRKHFRAEAGIDRPFSACNIAICRPYRQTTSHCRCSQQSLRLFVTPASASPTFCSLRKYVVGSTGNTFNRWTRRSLVPGRRRKSTSS